MKDKIENIIPTLFEEIGSDNENESEELLRYYICCNPQEREVINNVMLFICGWRFETLLEKCGMKFDEQGRLKVA
jgi:hypothetical protein